MTATFERTINSFYTLPRAKSFVSGEGHRRSMHFEPGRTSTASGGVDSRFLWQQKLLKASKAVLHLRTLKDDWDSHGARAAGEQAVINALSLLSKLGDRRILPDYVAATDDGGVLLEYRSRAARYIWECEEDGDIGILIRYADGREESADFRHAEISKVIARFYNG